MSIAIIHSRAQLGVSAPPVTIEVHLSNGLPSLSIVGLPEAAVKESKDRVRSALLNSRFEFPLKRITINLAPADLPKQGGRYDLPIALGILAASGQVPTEQLNNYEFIGELALTGEVRPVTGALPFALACQQTNRISVIPKDNVQEAIRIQSARILPCPDLLSLCSHLHGQNQLAIDSTTPKQPQLSEDLPDMQDVRGQDHAKRALEIAAAGGHNLLFVGPPGTGKSMLANRLRSILPDMSEQEAIETASIHSLTSLQESLPWRTRPYRNPHHTSSAVALVGGGSHPRPGEISLAHHGVLFLDELPEFDRKVLEVLREPLETGLINISRAAHQAQFPAEFQLIAAMNPCPCGFAGDPEGRCHCTPDQIRRYRNKISGPLLDRIDLHVEVPALPKSAILDDAPSGEPSKQIKLRVSHARERQLERNQVSNAQLNADQLREVASLDQTSQNLLATAIERLGLSARSVDRIRKVARTIADLDGQKTIQTVHISEAIGYRRLDRNSS